MAKVNFKTDFHQAKWCEPMIYELSTPGLRGIIPPIVEDEIVEVTGASVSSGAIHKAVYCALEQFKAMGGVN